MQADSELTTLPDPRIDALTFGLETHTTAAIRALIDGDFDEALRLMSESHWIAETQADYILHLKETCENLTATLQAMAEELNKTYDHLAATQFDLEAIRRDLPSVERAEHQRGYLEALEDVRHLLYARDMDTNLLDHLPSGD